MKSGSCRVNIVNNDDAFGDTPTDFKRSGEVQRALRTAESGLAGRVLPAMQCCRVDCPVERSEEFCNQSGLVESSATFAFAMQRNGHHDMSLKRFALHAFAQQP